MSTPKPIPPKRSRRVDPALWAFLGSLPTARPFSHWLIAAEGLSAAHMRALPAIRFVVGGASCFTGALGLALTCSSLNHRQSLLLGMLLGTLVVAIQALNLPLDAHGNLPLISLALGALLGVVGARLFKRVTPAPPEFRIFSRTEMP